MSKTAAGGDPGEVRHVHPDEESSPGVLLTGGLITAALVIFVVQIPVGIFMGNVFDWLMQIGIITMFMVPLVGGALAWGIDKITRYRDRVTASIIFGVFGLVLGGLWGLVLADAVFLPMLDQDLNPNTAFFAFVVSVVLAITFGLAMGLGRLWADAMAQRVVTMVIIAAALFTIALIGAVRTLFIG